MAIARRLEVKAFIFIALASLSWVVEASSRGIDLRARRGLTDVVPEDLITPDKANAINSINSIEDTVPTDTNAKTEDCADDGSAKKKKGGDDKKVHGKDNEKKKAHDSPKSDKGNDKSKAHSPKSDKGDDKSKAHSPKSDKGDDKSKTHSPKSDKGDDKSKAHSPKSDKGDAKSKAHPPKSDKGDDKKKAHSPKSTPESPTPPVADGPNPEPNPPVAVGPNPTPEVGAPVSGKIFNVNSYGAKGDGKTNNAQQFIKTWLAACKSGGAAIVQIPVGIYVAGPVVFQGPCSGAMGVEVRGTIKATSDISDYTDPQWFSFEKINGFTLYGGGTFDGQGAQVWSQNDCKSNSDCQMLPTSLKFFAVNNAVFRDITSINPKSFHSHINGCNNFKVFNLKITAPEDSPNTDGMHVSESTKVSISNSVIGTGDDCISVGDGITGLTISKITCGPGHGISIGSLGRYQHENPVSGIMVTDCTFKGTTNGVRIKTWPGSPPGKASDITFQNIVMTGVKNPIIIDQEYGSSKSSPSRVAVSGVHYRNIRGTSATPVAVSLICSASVPCGVDMTGIDFGKATAECKNAHVTATGTNSPTCA